MGKIVDCMEVTDPADMIPGVTFGSGPDAVPYVEYRGRFKGSLKLKDDLTGASYSYDMPVWIIAPRDPANGNGTVIISPHHTVAVQTGFISGAEGEQPLALKTLGPRFLFRRGKLGATPKKSYTWVGVRWDPRVFDPPPTAPPGNRFRYDGKYEQKAKAAGQAWGLNQGVIAAPPDRQDDVGIAMLADLADEVRNGVLTTLDGTSTPFATTAGMRLIAVGQSQTGRLLSMLLHDPPPSPTRSGPLFDGWLLCSARGRYERWRKISAATPTHPNGQLLSTDVIRDSALRTDPTGLDNGLVIDLGTEQDIQFRERERVKQTGAFTGKVIKSDGNERVRFGNPAGHRSYEVAGAQHFGWSATALQGQPPTARAAIFLPDLTDSLAELAAISGLAAVPNSIQDAFLCTPWTNASPPPWKNPLNWNPVARALMEALERWIDFKRAGTAGAPPVPDSASIQLLVPVESLDPTPGMDQLKRDALGNALGGVRLPDVAVGRGRFYGPHLGTPDSQVDLGGAYVDNHEAFEEECYRPPPRPTHGGLLVTGLHYSPHIFGPQVDIGILVHKRRRDYTYVREFRWHAQALVDAGFLLPEDRDALVDSAYQSAVGYCPELHVPPLGPFPERPWPFRWILRLLQTIFGGRPKAAAQRPARGHQPEA